MAPELPAGTALLADQCRVERKKGCLYAARLPETCGLTVRQADRTDEGGWQLVSSHPRWESIPWTHDIETFGEVVWAGRILLGRQRGGRQQRG